MHCDVHLESSNENNDDQNDKVNVEIEIPPQPENDMNTSVTNEILVPAPAEKKEFLYYHMYIDTVEESESTLRTHISVLIKTDLTRAKEYNTILNFSKMLNKIVPKQMPRLLYITKDKKYDKRVNNRMMQLLWEDRLASSPVYF